jgi:hypothetical protein
VPAGQAVQWLAQVAVVPVRATVDDQQGAVRRALGLRDEQPYGRICGHSGMAFGPHAASVHQSCAAVAVISPAAGGPAGNQTDLCAG